jgi:hypothetical protein
MEIVGFRSALTRLAAQEQQPLAKYQCADQDGDRESELLA